MSSDKAGCATPTLVTFAARLGRVCQHDAALRQRNRRSHASAALQLNCHNYYVFRNGTNCDLQQPTQRLTGGIREPMVAGAFPYERCCAHPFPSASNKGNPGRNRDRGPEARPQQQHTAGYDPTRSPCPTWIVLSFEHLRARLLPFSSVDSERTSTAVDNVAYVILTLTGENAAGLRRRENQNRTRMRFSGHRLRIKIRI